MKLRLILAAIAASLVLTLVAVSADQTRSTPAAAGVPTFTKDVAPILFKNCTTCHRPGEIAPMSLLTYEDARPNAQGIIEEVEAGHMPPWHAEAPEGTFLNERRLSAAEKDTLLTWAKGGAPRGNPADMPAPPVYSEGWQLGQPDVVFELPEAFTVPASGTVPYEYFYIPTEFKEAKWVESIEIRPTARQAVHHVLAFYRAVPDQPRVPSTLIPNREQMREAVPVFGTHPPQRSEKIPNTGGLVATYAPGTNPQVMPFDTAIRLAPGGVFELQVHYTAFGTEVKDRTKVGIRFSKKPAPKEIRITHFFNTGLVLPAGADNVEITADMGFSGDTTVYGIFPHTHLRGKRWQYELQLPDGTKKIILDVPRYDFNWQTYYMFKEPLRIPAGAKLISRAWYDNSTKNPSNPDPKVDVKWGDQTWEEMQYTGLLFAPVPKPASPAARR